MRNYRRFRAGKIGEGKPASTRREPRTTGLPETGLLFAPACRATPHRQGAMVFVRSLPGAIEGSRDMVGFPGSQGACHLGRNFGRLPESRFPDGSDGGRGETRGPKRARHDGSMTNGSKLDHFMCEICAANLPSLPLALRGRVGEGGPRRGFSGKASVMRAARGLPPLQLSPHAGREPLAARASVAVFPNPPPQKRGREESRAVEENCAAGSPRSGGDCAAGKLRRHGERGEQRLR
jgi:hypothetical protein